MVRMPDPPRIIPPFHGLDQQRKPVGGPIGSIAEGKGMKDVSTAQVGPSGEPSAKEAFFSRAEKALIDQDIVELWKNAKAAVPSKPAKKKSVAFPSK